MNPILETGQWVIAQVTYSGVDPWCLESFWNLAHELHDRNVPLPMMVNIAHTYVTAARQVLAEQVLEVSKSIPIQGILWIDSDMQFGPWDVIAIISHAEKIPEFAIVGALYPARRSEGMVGRLIPEMPGREDENHPSGLKWAEFLGFGLIWTPIECFQEMKTPWFYEPWDPDRNHFTGEDIQFCNRWRMAGHPVLAYESVTVRHAYSPGPRPLDDANRGDIQTLKSW